MQGSPSPAPAPAVAAPRAAPRENKATASWQAIVGAELYGSYGYLVRDQDTPSDGLTRGPSDGIPWHKLRVLAKSVF